MTETVDAALQHASRAIDAIKRAKPATTAEARRRASELVRQEQALIDAAHKITETAVAKRVTDGGAAAAVSPGLTREVLGALAEALVPFLRELMTEEFEKQLVMRDGGVWKADKSYRPGEVVTHSSRLWICQTGNSGLRPGTNNAWRMPSKEQQ